MNFFLRMGMQRFHLGDESLIEISTDKVDSDVPSEVSGVLIEKKFGIDKIVKVGENVKIKTLAEHEMETGVRRDNITGVIYPRLIIQSVIAKYNGKIVFKANWFSGVSANPYLAFYITAKESGLIEIEWKADHATTSF